MTDENGPGRSSGPAGGILPVPSDGTDRALTAPDAVIAFQDRLLRLIERRAAIFTMGDSSSVPRHVAVDLMQSICFVLGIDPDDPEVPPHLLSVDLDSEYRRRLAEVERKVELAVRLVQEARAGMPVIPNIALRDTLASIGGFQARYDFRSMAHEIPCSIDYPLCHPVPESLAGVDYVNEYLRRLLVENDFLRRFEVAPCVGVLEATCPDYRGLIINLCEPIATNAIGRALVGEGPPALDVSDADRAEIARLLGPMARDQRARVVREAALAVCSAVGIRDDGAVEYLCDLVPELMPRIELGLARGDLSGVFVSCTATGGAAAVGSS